jgi:hypothetical protein
MPAVVLCNTLSQGPGVIGGVAVPGEGGEVLAERVFEVLGNVVGAFVLVEFGGGGRGGILQGVEREAADFVAHKVGDTLGALSAFFFFLSWG